MLIAELGGCLPAEPCSLYWMPATSQASAGLFSCFTHAAEPAHIQNAALFAVVEAFHEAA